MSATLVRLAGAPVSVWLMSRHLSQVEQGYYYTFSSLLSLQQVIELGVGPRLVQFVSHEWGKVTSTASQPSQRETALRRFFALRVLARNYYTMGSLLLFLILLVSGVACFWNKSESWALPWFFVIFAFCGRFYFQRTANILEGIGQFRRVYQIRAVEATLMVITTWAALYFNQGLWVLSISYSVGGLVSVTWLVMTQRRVSQNLPPHPGQPEAFPWRAEMWPLFWRQGLSSAVGILSSVFPVILFTTRGPQEAGLFGLTWSLIGALELNLANAYMTSFWPEYGVLAGRRDLVGLEALHRRCRGRALLIVAGGAVTVLSCFLLSHHFHWKLAARLLPLNVTALLMLGVGLQELADVEAQFVRAHKQEPFLPYSLACSTIIGVGSWLFTPRYGSLAIGVLHVGIHLFIALPATIYFANKIRRES